MASRNQGLILRIPDAPRCPLPFFAGVTPPFQKTPSNIFSVFCWSKLFSGFVPPSFDGPCLSPSFLGIKSHFIARGPKVFFFLCPGDSISLCAGWRSYECETPVSKNPGRCLCLAWFFFPLRLPASCTRFATFLKFSAPHSPFFLSLGPSPQSPPGFFAPQIPPPQVPLPPCLPSQMVYYLLFKLRSLNLFTASATWIPAIRFDSLSSPTPDAIPWKSGIFPFQNRLVFLWCFPHHPKR